MPQKGTFIFRSHWSSANMIVSGMANGHCADCRWEVWSEISRTHCRNAERVASFVGNSENGILSPWSLDDCMGWKYWCPLLGDQDIPAPERQTAGYRPSLDICHRCHRCHHACCHWCSGTLPKHPPFIPYSKGATPQRSRGCADGPNLICLGLILVEVKSTSHSSPYLPFFEKGQFLFCKLILDEFLSCLLLHCLKGAAFASKKTKSKNFGTSKGAASASLFWFAKNPWRLHPSTESACFHALSRKKRAQVGYFRNLSTLVPSRWR